LEVFICERSELQSIIQSQNDRIESLLPEIVSLRNEVKSLRLELENNESERKHMSEEISKLCRFPCLFKGVPSDSSEFMVFGQFDGVLQAVAVSPDPAKHPNRHFPGDLGLE
jgi:hypothetical protein